MVRKFSIFSRIARHFGSWKNSSGIRLVLFLSLGIFFYFILSGHLISKTYDLDVNSVANQPIYAPKQIPDMSATAAAEQKAMDEVGPVYTQVNLKHTVLVGSILDKIVSLNSDEQLTNTDKASVYRLYFDTEYRVFIDQYLRTSDYSDALQQEMAIEFDRQKYRIPEEAFFKFPMLTEEDIKQMKPVLEQIVSSLASEPLRNAENARSKVPELVNGSSLNKQLVRELATEIARYVITPTSFFDQEGTELAKEEAKQNVQPVFIEKGDVIVEAGAVITPEVYELLRENNLLKERSYWPQLGLIMLVTLIVTCLYMFVRQSAAAIKTDNVQLLLLLLIITLNLIGLKIVSLGQDMGYPSIAYLAPVAAGSILIAILLEAGLAFVSSVLFSIAASVLFNQNYPESLFDFHYGLVALTVCLVSVFAIYKASQRSSILKAGMMVSLFAVFSLIALQLIGGEFVIREILLALSFAFASGILTAVLVIGLLPFFEIVFGILSPLKLVELSNPNHPLMRKLLTETPGTYHHSIMVANLSEAAAEAIGANGLLCRVGSFYHDIGKTRRPGYFIENQSNTENPHDQIDPYLSKSIIIAHARDGVEMLQEYKMPKLICDIAEQHHGTSLLSYFYHKALKIAEAKGEQDSVKEEDFRYPGPKAQMKESAIVGIADSVEAAVRSMRNPTMEQIDTLVDKIVKSRLDDHQLNECDLTMKELDQIANTLKKTLLGMFHSRIEYPEPQNENDKGVVTHIHERGKSSKIASE